MMTIVSTRRGYELSINIGKVMTEVVSLRP
jgi:hypothetical protein